MGCILGTCHLLRGRGAKKWDPQYMHSVCQTVRISVLKFAEKGVFKIRICMSANLENSRKSEKRVLILLHNDIIFGQLIEAHLKNAIFIFEKQF